MEKVTFNVILMALLVIRSQNVETSCSLETTFHAEPCQGVLTCIQDFSMASGLINGWECRRIEEYDYRNYNHYRRIRTSNLYTISVRAQNIQDSVSFDAIIELSDHISSISVTKENMSSVPPEIKRLNLVKEIDVSNNLIQSIQLQEFSGKNVEVFNVSFNIIDELKMKEPTGQNIVNNLTTIDLSNNLIRAIPNNYFVSFPQLQHLNLSHNSIESFDILTFEGLANLKTLYVSGNILTNLGQNFARFIRMQELLLDQNYLTSIESFNFGKMSNLEKLDLSCNRIKSVDDLAFGDLLALMKLNMSGNKLDRISKNWFQNNNNLTSLDMSNNTINQIERGVFEGKSITEFKIQNNNLSGILETGIFRGINTDVLDISGAHITELGPDLFNSPSDSFKLLNFSRNSISKIHNSTFNELEFIQTLDLSHNKLHVIEFNVRHQKNLSSILVNDNSIIKISRNVFKDLSTLKTVDLSNNDIVDIEVLSFQDLSEVELLNLSNNPLPTEIAPYQFTGLTSCTNLDLSYTKVTTIHKNAFSGMHSLNTFNMSYGCLKVLEYEALNGTGFIDLIDLSHNQIELFLLNNTNIKLVVAIDLSYNSLQHITAETFSGLDNLLLLYLNHNNIASIEHTAFRTLCSLVTLRLSDNKEMMFNSSIFSNLTSLESLYLDGVVMPFQLENAANTSIKKLDLSSCGITDVYLVKLYQLRTMEWLTLNSNKIRSIDKFSFEKLETLTRIKLSNNLISNIQPSSFSQCNDLVLLNLSSNFISSLQFGVFDGLTSLRVLDLSSNTLHSFRVNIFHNAPHLYKVYLDDNLIDDIFLDEFRAANINKVSIGGNKISCDNLTALNNSVHPNFTVTTKVRKYDTENVNGITCESSTKLERLIPVHVNDTVLTTALLNTIEEFKLTVEKMLSRNESKGNLDRAAFNNVSLSIKQFQDILNRSEHNRNTFMENSMGISNSSNLYLKNILGMLKDRGFTSSNDGKINDDDIERKVNKLLELQRETLKTQFTSMFNEWKTRNVEGERNHQELVKSLNVGSEGIKTTLYFIAVCLVVLLFVMILIGAFYVKYKKRVQGSFRGSRQPISNSMQMQ